MVADKTKESSVAESKDPIVSGTVVTAEGPNAEPSEDKDVIKSKTFESIKENAQKAIDDAEFNFRNMSGATRALYDELHKQFPNGLPTDMDSCNTKYDKIGSIFLLAANRPTAELDQDRRVVSVSDLRLPYRFSQKLANNSDKKLGGSLTELVGQYNMIGDWLTKNQLLVKYVMSLEADIEAAKKREGNDMFKLPGA